MTDLHEPLDSYSDELPPPRQRGHVNLVSLLSMADDLAKEMSALHVREKKCSAPEVVIMPQEMVQKNLEKHATEVLDKVVTSSSTSGTTPRAGTSSKTAPQAASPTPSKLPAAPRPTLIAARSYSPSILTMKGSPSAALSGSARTTPSSSCTTA
ncbi:hypothetical protein AB0L85_30230 [Streptomyces sp. NPDC052051]|uniref:hypothetical protein n=1 Tax=Streptomyces sp. NPDC052051 TaxID=3154649 RepID=UPI00342B86A4